MESKKDKLVFFLPNIFTSLNIACGFIAILFSMQQEFEKACFLIILGAVFDSVDGRVARLVGAESSFGEQYDSLSDLITFGMAPSLIYYNKFLIGTGRIGMVVSFFFLLCGALRLARFNANISKVKSDYFQGMPIPGAATAIIGFIYVSDIYSDYLYSTYVVVPYLFFYAFLMISNLPFTSFKNSSWVRRHKRATLFLLLVLLIAILSYHEIMLFVVISVYVISCLIYFLTHRKKFKHIFDWEEDEEKV
jgi:CDP-diacylglycerol--serine O-phosphatidyltransferase